METINHEYYVSLEVAKLLKEAGFDWKCMCYYTLINPKVHTPNNGVIAFMKKYEELFKNHNETKLLPIYSAPTLDVAQRWLREVKDIYTMVFKDFATINGWHYFVVKKEDWESGNESNFYQQESNHHTYEEAQETGIKKALEIILEKGE